MSDDDNTNLRNVPKSDLDFNLMITETLWGSPYVNEELKSHLTKKFQMKDEAGNLKYDEEGEPVLTEKALWGVHAYYTRDLRLSNLSYKSGEIPYCAHYLDLAGDFLRVFMLDAFNTCIARVATITELAQSKGGFLRRQLNTLRTEQA
ncbi:hypothetical protein DRH27_05910, partial [Candidatus Falkowbacteria bacterium]